MNSVVDNSTRILHLEARLNKLSMYPVRNFRIINKVKRKLSSLTN